MLRKQHKTLVLTPDEQIQLIEKAMEDAQSVTKNAIDEHWQAFLSQMRDKLGVENIQLDEPNIQLDIVKNTLQYLKRLDRLEMSLTSGDSAGSAGIDLPARLELEQTRNNIRVKQSMDEQRQQEFGIEKYIWHCSDEACSICAPNDEKIFSWSDGDGPGEIHPNCQCSAEPGPDGNGEPVDHSTRDMILEIAQLLASLLPAGRAVRIGIAAVRGLGKVGDAIINSSQRVEPELQPKLPPEKPSESPTNKPNITNNIENEKSAEKIANGHAYDKHVEKKGEFPEIKTREDLKNHIEDVMNNPTKTKDLDNGRTGYWDKKTGSVVIENPNDPDGGTIFRPTDSENYFNNILK